MKIIYICHEYPPLPHGGIGTFTYTIAHAMKERGHQVTVVGWGREAREWDDEGVRVVELKRFPLKGFAWYFKRQHLRRFIRDEARQGRVDIVESAEYIGSLISPIPEVPVVLRLHLSDTAIARQAGRNPWKIEKFCERRMLSLFRYWIAVSPYVLGLTEKTFGISPLESRVIYNPIAPLKGAEIPPLDLPDKFVLYAGNLSRRKGVDLLAEAAKTFFRGRPNLYLVYAGWSMAEGGISAEDRIRAIVGPELSRRVLFLGRVDRPTLFHCMRKALVFANPSSLESFGLVSLEALSQGCPIVVNDSGPNKELFTDGENALIVPAGDALAFSKAVERLLADPALAQGLSKAGKAYAETNFSVEECVEKTLKFYSEIVEKVSTLHR